MIQHNPDSEYHEGQTLLLPAINSSGSSNFAPKLLEYINKIITVDHLTAVSYHKRRGLETLITYGSVPDKEARSLARKYEQEYHRDPNFSQLEHAQEQPVKPIPFSPEDISDEDYIKTFYTNNGIVDKISTIVCVGNDRILSSFYRCFPNDCYNDQDKIVLNIILPMATSLIYNHYRLVKAESKKENTETNHSIPQGIHSIISSDIPPFSLLSLRERDICERTLLGSTAAEISNELGIAQSTVITHRKRAYNKLSIASHKDLFTLFLKASQTAN